jgi:hypothetical protein
MRTMFEYDVALSFAGENRNYVDAVAKCLKNSGVKLFYDNFEEANLWGKDLYEYLDDIYKNKARYCIMFISAHYAEKVWTTHERKSAQERAIREKGIEYILPARFDDTVIPGIRDTIGYINLNNKTPEKFCKIILEKLQFKLSVEKPKVQEEKFDIFLPSVKKKFTDLEKSHFLNDSFTYLKKYFTTALTKLKEQHKFIETNYEDVTNKKFVARIYYYGELKSVCKVWIDKGLYKNSIAYLEGSSELDVNSDNNYNDNAPIEDDGYEMYFRASMSIFVPANLYLNPERLTKEGLAKYYWGMFIHYLTI